MASLTGIVGINQSLELISQELNLIKNRAVKHKLSADQRDKITETDIKGFVQTLGGRLALLDQRTSDLLKFVPASPKDNLNKNPDYTTTDQWAKEILRQLSILRTEQAFHLGAAAVSDAIKWNSGEDLVWDDSRNAVNVFAKVLDNIENHVRQARYKIKVDKTDTQKNA